MSIEKDGYRPFNQNEIASTISTIHNHEYWQFVFVKEGFPEFFIDDQIYQAKINEMILIPPYHPHGILKYSDENIRHFGLYLTNEFLRLAGARQIDFERILMDLTGCGQYCFTMSENDLDECRRLISELMLDDERQSSWKRFSDVSRIFPILRMSIDTMHNSEQEFPKTSLSPTINRVISYIDSSFTSRFSLKELSRMFGVSVSALSHEFKNYTGRSIYEYVLQKRILLAKQRIFEDVPLSEISLQCGFTDYSNFLRQFNLIVGTSPSKYRKSLKKSD